MKKIDVKKKEGWAIRSTIGSCPQVHVILKSVSALYDIYTTTKNNQTAVSIHTGFLTYP
jgi:hypothetical protein